MRNRFVVLDSFRGIAALAVAFGHVKTSGWLSTLSLSTTSYRFVDFFFILSGFVIAFSSTSKILGDPKAVVSFLFRRIARLWPLHIFVLALFIIHQITLLVLNSIGILAEPIAFSDEFSLEYLPHNVALVQAWGTISQSTWNKPAWSISSEVFAYILFAISCLIFRRAVYLLAYVAIFFLFLFVVRQPEIMTSTFSGALVRCLTGFTIGFILFRLYHYCRDWVPPHPNVLEPVLLLITIIGITSLPSSLGAFILPIFAATIFIYSFESGFLSSFFKRYVFVFFGRKKLFDLSSALVYCDWHIFRSRRFEYIR